MAKQIQKVPPKHTTISYARYGIYFVLPYFVVFGVFQLFPIIYTFYLTFFSWDGFNDMIFVGLGNYRRLLADRVFFTAVRNTFRIWILAAIPQIGLALFLGAVFTFRRMKGSNLFQAIFYLPNLITATSIAILFSLLLDWQAGAINQVLLRVGALEQPVNWLRSAFWTSGAVSLIQWWQWFGYTTLLVMAGMKAIPGELYESARIDGAGSGSMFFRITLPLLKNTLTYVVVTAIIGGLQIFDVPNVLTGGLGDPNRSILTMVMHVWNMSFRFTNYGYGATVAYGLFIIILTFSIVAFRQLQRRDS